MDDLFVRAVGPQGPRASVLHVSCHRVATVACRVKPSIHAAYQAQNHIPVNVTAVYAQLARVPTNVPAEATAARPAEMYRGRRSAEGLFLRLTMVPQCEVNTLGDPPATLFGFCVVRATGNVHATAKGASAGRNAVIQLVPSREFVPAPARG